MRIHGTILLVMAAVAVVALVAMAGPTSATTPMPAFHALQPISHGNLTIFPVVAPKSYDTHQFLTLDEGLRSGEVVVSENGGNPGLQRRPIPTPGPQVNKLMLVNNSDRALLLLAGEIVTGGKQDRVVGSDRIVPPKSDPVDLSVFCVEPGRWTGATNSFSTKGYNMAQPSVRRKAMADKDQAQVWAEVGGANSRMAAAAPNSAPGLGGTTSYAKVMDNKEVQQSVDAVAKPMERSYDNVMRELRDRKAVGVVVAVNGRIIWADLFASTSLLEKYWPKLVRSYAAESITVRDAYYDSKPAQADAQRFLNEMEGKREIVEVEPGVYRHAELQANQYKVFELTSLLPKTNFDVHVAKMVTTNEPIPPRPMIRRPVE